jgi:ubiquinone/menaquinone biosynthesis C-methylase UbiE
MPHKNDLPCTANDPRIEFFGQLAERWDEVGQNPSATVARLAELSSLLDLRPGTDLLEVGCGTGQITGWLAEQVAPGKVVAVDFSEAMLQQARRKHVAAEFRCADACHDDLGTQCFDVVLCFHSFPHFRDQSAAVTNLARALRASGRLIVMHLAGSHAINTFHDHVGGAVAGDHLPSLGIWQTLLASAGLEVRQHEDCDGLFMLVAVSVGPMQ